MTPLLSAEWLKLRTTRAFWVAVPLVLALAAALPVINGAVAGKGDVAALTASSVRDFVRGPASLGGAVMLLLGLLATAGEFRHRTVFLTRLAEPRSTRVLGSKLATIGLVGIALGLALDVLSLASGSVVLHGKHLPIHVTSYGVPRLLVLVPLVVAAYGVLGVAVGTLIRSTAGAVGFALVWAFVIEGVLPLVARSPHLADRLPSGVLKAVLDDHATAGGPSPLVAGALVAAYAAGLVAVAAVLDARREL